MDPSSLCSSGCRDGYTIEIVDTRNYGFPHFASRMTALQDVRETPAFAGMTMQQDGDAGINPA